MQRNLVNIIYKANLAIYPYSFHTHFCHAPKTFGSSYSFLYRQLSFLDIPKRNTVTSSNKLSREKSKIKETVKVLKSEAKKKESKETKEYSATVSQKEKGSDVTVPAKRSLLKRVKDEIIHYYHGFRLLFIDIKVASKLVWQILNGKELTRRQNRQLVRTVGDIFRLVPFSVFILVPFMELLLPVFVKLFPQMLPSTFETASEKEKKFKAQLKLKIEMAKFLQETLDELALKAKGETHSEKAKEFANFFEKIRSSDEMASNQEIMQHSKLFEDQLTLDNLSRPSLTALCRLLDLQPIGTTHLLRFQLNMRLRHLRADDKVIRKEGIDSLNIQEMQQACRARGMTALGLSEKQLKEQLQRWLELSLKENIPSSLLLLSRALYLPENLPAEEQLKTTLSTLPEGVTTEAKYKIGKKEGKVDNKTKLELIKKEEDAIKKETEEIDQEKQKEQVEAKKKMEVISKIVKDKAQVLEDKAVLLEEGDISEEKELTKEDFEDLENALEKISIEKKQLIVEKEKLEDLKEVMAEYKDDIEELKDSILQKDHTELKESKAALRLSKKVNKIISKMDTLLDELAEERKNLQQKIDDKQKDSEVSKEKDDIVSIDELVSAIRRIQKVSDDAKLQKIIDVLKKMDVNHDGNVEIDHVLKVIKLLGKDNNVKITSSQMDEIIDLLMKEDIAELEEKIEKEMQMVENERKGKSEGKNS